MSADQEHEALEVWRVAYERTDLIARLAVAALLDHRQHGTAPHLGPVIESQLDRFEQARDLERIARDYYEQLVEGVA